MPSVTLKDVDQQKFVKAFSAFLKKTGKMKVPEWVDIVKSARFKELAPYDEDWYYTRCAALARHIYFRSPVGVGAVTKIFGDVPLNSQALELLRRIREFFEQEKVKVHGHPSIPADKAIQRTAAALGLLTITVIYKGVKIQEKEDKIPEPFEMQRRQRNGVCPSHFCRGAGGVARKALQSLEQLKLIEKTADGGRRLTVQGRRDLDRIAAQVRQKKQLQPPQ